MDENARALYAERYGVRSTIAVPLVVAGRWIGYVDGLYTEQTEFPEADVRLLTALVAQAAVVIQGLRQLEETQARAERERQVRSIADRVRGRANREDTMRVALQELRQMLGASEAVIRLGTREQLLPVEKTTDEESGS
jgi:GAF domain-containing protein